MNSNSENTLLSKSRELFGEELNNYYCELVITALLGREAGKLLGKDYAGEWFDNYYGFDHFDYVILIARKGYSSFRAYLRTVEEDLSDVNKKIFEKAIGRTIITNSRTTSFLMLGKDGEHGEVNKPVSELRILILDDLLKKGRNISRITENIMRLGFSEGQIFYAALGYHMMQKKKPKKKDDYCTWITQGRDKSQYYINFSGGAIKNKKIRIFLPHSLADNNFLQSTEFFMDRYMINSRTFNFNRFLHYAMIPYTGYMSHYYFSYGENKVDIIPQESRMRAESRIFDVLVKEMKPQELKIESCKNIIQGYIFKMHSVSESGYYTSFRVFRNVGRNELLLYPFVFLPVLTAEKLRNCYVKLLDKCDLGKINSMMEHLHERVQAVENVNEWVDKYTEFRKMSADKDDYAKRLGLKSIYEHMSRSLICIISAIMGVRFIEDNLLFSEEKDSNHRFAITIFAKNLMRYYCVGKNNHKNCDCLEDYERFLEKCIFNFNNVENSELFAFNDFETDKCLSIEEVGKYYRLGKDERLVWQEIVGKFDRYRDPGNENIIFLSAKQKKDTRLCLADMVSKLSEEDEFVHYKIPPIPTHSVIKTGVEVCKRVNSEESEAELYDAFMVSLQSITEDGVANIAMYAESTREQPDEFICMNALQCGEMAILFAGMVFEDFGGWTLVNELRNLFLAKIMREYRDPSINERFYIDLTNVIEEVLPQETSIIMGKIKYLFDRKDILSLTKDATKYGEGDEQEDSDSNYDLNKLLLKRLRQFRLNLQ